MYSAPGMGKGRDSPAKICPSSKDNQINASNEFRDSGTERYLRQIESRDSGTDRESCPEMSGFVVPRDFSSRTVQLSFVPVPTVPWL